MKIVEKWYQNWSVWLLSVAVFIAELAPYLPEVQQNLPLSGLAGEILGIGIVNAPATAVVSLSINNDLILDKVPAQAVEIDAASGNPRAFYEIPRPLNGQDTITLSVVDTAPNLIQTVIWYRGRKID